MASFTSWATGANSIAGTTAGVVVIGVDAADPGVCGAGCSARPHDVSAATMSKAVAATHNHLGRLPGTVTTTTLDGLRRHVSNVARAG